MYFPYSPNFNKRCGGFMALKPIKRVNIAEKVFEQLRDQILHGVWKEGEKLPSEQELTETLGVSRSSVRQAIRTLSDYGMVETRNGTGTYVKRQISGNYMLNIVPIGDLQFEDIIEVLDFLCLIEDSVAAMAVQRSSQADLSELREIHNRLLEAKNRNDLEALTNIDVEFHSKIAMITQNSLVIQTYALLLDFLQPVMHRSYETLGTEEGIPYHEGLIQAFCEHDAVAAKNVMSSHAQNRRDKFLAIQERN